MVDLKLFYKHGQQVRVIMLKIEDWGKTNGVNVKLDDYKPHVGTKQHYLRLGITNDSSHTCQCQMK